MNNNDDNNKIIKDDNSIMIKDIKLEKLYNFYKSNKTIILDF